MKSNNEFLRGGVTGWTTTESRTVIDLRSLVGLPPVTVEEDTGSCGSQGSLTVTTVGGEVLGSGTVRVARTGVQD